MGLCVEWGSTRTFDAREEFALLKEKFTLLKEKFTLLKEKG